MWSRKGLTTRGVVEERERKSEFARTGSEGETRVESQSNPESFGRVNHDKPEGVDSVQKGLYNELRVSKGIEEGCIGLICG